MQLPLGRTRHASQSKSDDDDDDDNDAFPVAAPSFGTHCYIIVIVVSSVTVRGGLVVTLTHRLLL